jgi:hypothetical protein
MKLIPKNWDNFQHYKHRSPPWIKLHRNLLDDMHYQRLPIASKALAPMLWLLASESNSGVIEKTTEEIAFRLRMPEKDVINAIKPLIDNGFFSDADNMLADCLQDATTEKRQSRVREEKEKETDTPVGVAPSIFKDYLAVRKAKKSPLTKTALEGLQREADKAKMSLQDVMQLCCERNWVGFKAEWANSQNPVSKQGDDKSWMFSNQGIEAKAKELGVNDYGIQNHQQLKDKVLLVMAKKAMQ